MTKQTIYDTIVSLTTELKPTNIGLKLFEAAKSSEGAGQKVSEVLETFANEYPELYQKIWRFADDFNEYMSLPTTSAFAGEIFGAKEDKENGITVFDPNIIHASSFFAFTFITDIDEVYLFTGECIEIGENEWLTDDVTYLDALEEESGSTDLANFLANASFSFEEIDCLSDSDLIYDNICDLLADVFAGKLREYIE